MIYKILCKSFGSKPVLFTKIKSDFEIHDFCFAINIGYFFTSNQCIGHVDLRGNVFYPFIGREGENKITHGFREAVTFSDPSAICFSQTNRVLLVVEENGKRVRSIDTIDDYYCLTAVNNVDEDKVDTFYRRKYPLGKTSIYTDGYNLSWTMDNLNLVFNSWNSNTLKVIGCGKGGYASSSLESYHCINKPSGLLIKNNTLYVSDKRNHCIRAFSKEDKIIVGHPIISDIEPEKIISIKNAFYFIDRGSVKCLSSFNTKPFIEYSGESVISIAVASNDSVISNSDKLAILIRE